MDMYPQYKSPLGYSTGDNKIDAYGVDHSGFSTRDELEYQFARQNKENQLIQNYNNQGITKNYPQYGTNFWGSSPDNNYGFGSSNIHNNIENMQNQTNFGNSTQWGMNDTSLGLQNNELGNNQELQAVNKNISPQETLWYENLGNETSKFGKIFAKEIKSDLADVGYGAKKALNGLTLGGSDWVMRRLGMDNEDEYLAQKDAEGTGVAAQIGGTVSEIGGNMLGAGTGIVKGLGKLGLTGTKLAGVSGLVEGGITGAANSDTWSELPQKIMTGSALGLIGGVAGQKVLDMVIKPFSSKVATYGMNGGMENVIANPEATSLVVRGIKQNDDLAKQALGQIPPVSKNLNNQTADILQQSLGHKINLPQTIAAQKPKTEQYVLQHADDEVLDFAPTITRYRPYDSIAVLKSIRRNMEKTNTDFKFRRNEVGNFDYPHLLKDTQRVQYIETLPSTYNNPQRIVAGSHNGFNRIYRLKRYYNPDSDKNVYDIIVTDSDTGKLVTKIARENKSGKREFEKILNERADLQVAEGARGLGQAGQTPIPNTARNKIINNYSLFVNPSLPNVSEVYKGLSGDAAAGMKQAISQGLDKTTQKAGSLDSVYRIKKELDNIVLAAKNSRSADYKALEQAQNNYSKFYANAMQGRDKGFNLEQAYNAGLNNQTTVLPMITPLEKNAFSQGLFTHIRQNNMPNQNMAASVLDYRSSLANALRPKSFNRLEQGLEQNAAQFNRLSAIGNAAESRLNLPQNQRMWRQGYVQPHASSFGSSWGQIQDTLQSNMLKNSTQNLLDPNFIGTQNNLVLEAYPKVGGFIPTQFYFENENK